MYMSNFWLTFSTDSSRSFTELSGNIIYNVNILYNFNGNLVDTSSNFIIYELSNNPIQGNVSLKSSNWKELNLDTILNPFQGYWLGGINTNLPQIFTNNSELRAAVNNWRDNPIPVVNIRGSIERWKVGNVTDMLNMFYQENTFNQDLNNWDVGNVENMSSMFNRATSFNGNITNWNVGNVRRMNDMFNGATSFNGNISNWIVGNVTGMSNMFRNAENFNQDISDWNVGNVTNMDYMFSGATSFNQDISDWDVGNVTSFERMFNGVTFFTDLSDQIDPYGTPFSYFNSQQTQ